ncbi:hypothetical protein ABEB36_014089 [Hypothenemus hampei]|uniref:BESS domain-containing protein n=1 Tax=Hypothenemus hampei TaxID=57062 RepID=A0ABD1E394_HYPHA
MQQSDDSYNSEENEEKRTKVIVNNNIDGTEVKTARNEVPRSSVNKSFSNKPSTETKKKPVIKNTVDKRCEEIYSIIKSVHHERQEHRDAQTDDFDLFGKIVARKIRNLPTRYARITLQHLINNLLYEGELSSGN